MTTDILASIDNTLAGYGAVSHDLEVSRDAMRWSPQRVICDGGQPMALGRKPELCIVSISISVNTGPFLTAMRAVGEAFSRFAADAAKIMPAITRLTHAVAAGDRKHRIRCRTCNPFGNPPPMPRSGYDYNRRRRARQRRHR